MSSLHNLGQRDPFQSGHVVSTRAKRETIHCKNPVADRGRTFRFYISSFLFETQKTFEMITSHLTDSG